MPIGATDVDGDCDDTDGVLTDGVRASWTTLGEQGADVTSNLTGSPSGLGGAWLRDAAPVGGHLVHPDEGVGTRRHHCGR